MSTTTQITETTTKIRFWALEDRERNYRDDSDFYAVCYDEEEDRICTRETGTTRCRMEWPKDVAPVGRASAEIVENAKVAWVRQAQALAESLDQYAVMEPSDAAHGDVLRLLADARYKGTKVPAGAVGEVFWCGAFGTFYRNGYNQPGRSNRRVGLRLQDGTRVFVALSKCRLDREPRRGAEMVTGFNGSWVSCHPSKGLVRI